MILHALDARDVAVFETFAVPRYLSTFGMLAVEMLIPSEGALIANIGCRTGFPDQILGKYVPQANVVGFDPSEPALELARTKAALIRDANFEYHASDIPLPIEDSTFSHVVSIHPRTGTAGREALMREMHRVLLPGGQAVLAIPLRGSFQEISDLMREYALKVDAPFVTKALESTATSRPTLENLSEDLEAAGFDDVDVEIRSTTLAFRSGRDFFEDPVSRLIVVPDIELTLGIGELTAPMIYVRDAIDRYWSETDFELTINVGCASARRY